MVLLKFQLMLESHVDWNYDKLFLKKGYGNSQAQKIAKRIVNNLSLLHLLRRREINTI